MQNTSQVDMRQKIADLTKLLRKVELTAEGSAKLDREFAKLFPSAPARVSRSIDALVRLIETELPGWWWTFGYCKLSNDASLYPPVSPRFRQQFSHASMAVDDSSRPNTKGLLEIPKYGKSFDQGFHCDLIGGTVLLSGLTVFLEAQIALARATRPTTEKNRVRVRRRDRPSSRPAPA
jgi:hypothetical protein